jgi:hypothetical protein
VRKQTCIHFSAAIIRPTGDEHSVP